MSSEEVTLDFVLPDWQKARGLNEARILGRTESLFSVHVLRYATSQWICVRGSQDSTEKAKVLD